MKRIIDYKITEASNFIYHILAQLDAKKEWGPANLYNKKYVNSLNLPTKFPLQIKKILIKIYSPFSFYPFNIKFNKSSDLINDLKNTNEINWLLNFFNEKSINQTEKNHLSDFLSEENNIYQKEIWLKKQTIFKKERKLFIKIENDLINKYLEFLDQINPKSKLPNEIIIYLIDALDTRGRGLNYGCATGLPKNDIEAKENLFKAMHELTHQYTDDLLKKLGYSIKVKPTDNKNHTRKEDAVNYVLKYFLDKKGNPSQIKRALKSKF